ncbi:conserved hypothetical protein [Verrucomicrobia bacterium]|nr:conserved hypothetical protein [Verrucomicrobiota bacterium]
MNEELFPSGPWTGFYNYLPGDRHRMELQLTFAAGSMSGDGADDVGRFLIKGRYDAASLECYWTKSYLGAHDVFYRGFREGKGIWGKWEIGPLFHGGFHIWPRGAGEAAGVAAAEQHEESVDAVGVTQARQRGVSRSSPRKKRRIRNSHFRERQSRSLSGCDAAGFGHTFGSDLQSARWPVS